MRETNGLVDSLVGYIKASLDENKAEDKVRQEEECQLMNVSCCFSSTPVFWIHLSACLCVITGGGKCSVCLEEPLLPALQWDASIRQFAPGRTKQSSELRKGWRHWLLYTSEQEGQKCKHVWDLPISILCEWTRPPVTTLSSCISLPLTEQEPGSLHFHWGCSGAKGYGVALAPTDSGVVQPCAA